MVTDGFEAASVELLTPRQVAGLFGVNMKTVTRWANAGKLSSVRTLGGHRRYSRAEVERLFTWTATASPASGRQ